MSWQARLRGLRRARQGAVVVETSIAVVPVVVFFASLCQLIDGYAHLLLVRRAASAAARAAVVVLPDDGAHYADPQQRTVDALVGARKSAIEAAALQILGASPSFHAADTSVEVGGYFGPGGVAAVTVRSRYACIVPGVRWVCGREGKLSLSAQAALPYQYAPYRHERG